MRITRARPRGSIHSDGGDAVIPTVAGFHLIALQVGDILLQAQVGATEILILKDGNGHATI